MKKRSTFDIVWRVILIPVAIIAACFLVDLAARFVWIGEPFGSSIFVNNNPTVEQCEMTIGSSCYWPSHAETERTLENYNTDALGWIMTHFLGLGLLVFIGAVLYVLGGAARELYKWAFYERVPAEDDDDLYVSECSDPHCRCSEHVVNDEFSYALNRWVEKPESSEPAVTV